MTNQPPDTATAIGRLYTYFSGHESSTGTRFLLIIGLAIGTHLLVKITRHISEWLIYKSNEKKNPIGFMTQKPKFITVTRLVVSGVTFCIYFFAIGFFLEELGGSLKTYLASSSVLVLAISFVSQGLVQDIVGGLTLIFWDVMDVGDLVEVSGTANVTGRVEEIGLRFTKIINFYHQEVFIPNRTIANVSRFPQGGLDAYADVQIPKGADAQTGLRIVEGVARGMWQQFGAIILTEPKIEKVEAREDGGWHFIRAHFKIWPGQGSLIETTFRQQIVGAMKALDPNYADWQVPVTYRADAVFRK
jgi:small conductance mechanosensitive channel